MQVPENEADQEDIGEVGGMKPSDFDLKRQNSKGQNYQS
jgi:hypothetical protein